VVLLVHDRLQLSFAGITFDQYLDANRLKAHLSRWYLQSATGTPGGWIANIALQEQLQAGEIHLLPGGHGHDSHRQAALPQTRANLAPLSPSWAPISAARWWPDSCCLATSAA
jgi:hypothetical protein